MSDWVNYFKDTSKARSVFNQCTGNKRLIELIIEHTPTKGHILEAGCGTAILSMILADYGYRVIALDYSEEILAYARNNICIRNEHLTFRKGDILNLTSQFEKDYFDITCHSGVMEHFSDADIVKSLSEQKIVSKIVIFNIPNNRNNLTEKHFGDERFLKNKRWVKLIKEAGFQRVSVYGDYNLPRFIKYPTLIILPGIFFHKKASFWWKYFTRHTIFVCE